MDKELNMQIALIDCEIQTLIDKIEMIEQTSLIFKAKLEVLKERKISIELYNKK